jgi:hypothetical protein
MSKEDTMTETEKPARYMRAYYHTFTPTGCDPVDAVLEAVAMAGKGYHNTDRWDEAEQYGPDGYWGLIQYRADAAATAWNTRPDAGEPVGVVGTMPGASGFTMASFEAAKVPVGTPLYTRPAPALDREGVARALHARYEERARKRGTFNAETDHTILGGRTLTDCSPSLRQSFLEDADAILAYADLHRAKGTRDGYAKADRNADLATIMCQALTAWNTRPDEGEPVAWVCEGCEHVYRDPVADLASIQAAGAASCCPGCKMQPLYTRPAPALDRMARAVAGEIAEALVYHDADVADAAERGERSDDWVIEISPATARAILSMVEAAKVPPGTPLYTRPAPALDREGAIEAAARAYHDSYFAPRATAFNGTNCPPYERISDHIKAGHRAHVTPIADAILAMVGGGVPAGEDAIKAAYMRGWNDREADFLERADAMGLPDAPASTVEG